MKHARNSTETSPPRSATSHPPSPPAASEREAAALPSSLSGDDRKEVVRILNALLADEFLLFTKTLNYHWNVEGMQFHSIHSFLEKHYFKLLEIADDLAERIRTIGGVPLGSTTGFLKATRLDEDTGEPPDPRTMLSRLCLDHAQILDRLRKDVDTIEEHYDDSGTCNFLLNLLEKQEKLAWMLRAHLVKIPQ